MNRTGIIGSIVFIALGAILRYAVSYTSSYINIQTTGAVLLVVGLLALVLSLGFALASETRKRKLDKARAESADPYYRLLSDDTTRPLS
jgi:hypothetical protein